MFLRAMPKLHVAIRFLIHAVGDEQAEAAIQGKVLKPPSKKLKGNNIFVAKSNIVDIKDFHLIQVQQPRLMQMRRYLKSQDEK